MACIVQDQLNYLDGCLIILIQVIAITGNGLFFIGLIKFPTLRNATNILLCCLASADIIVALVPMSVTFAIYTCNWGPRDQQDTVFKDISNAYLVLDIGCGTSSILSLTVIAMDRYFAINWPFVHQRVMKPQAAMFAVLAVWVIAAAASLVRLDLTLSTKYLTLSNILISFGIPVVIMTYCYVNIAIIARRQSIRIAQLNAAGTSLQRRSEQETETTNAELSGKEESGEKREQYEDVEETKQGKEKKNTGSKTMSTIRRGTLHAVTRIKAVGKELKAAKTLGIVMGVFILTWTPFMSLNIIAYMHCYPYTLKCKEMLPYELAKYFKLLHYACSALNPCLYVLLNRKWRDAFKKMLCCWSDNRVSGETRTSMIGGW